MKKVYEAPEFLSENVLTSIDPSLDGTQDGSGWKYEEEETYEEFGIDTIQS